MRRSTASIGNHHALAMAFPATAFRVMIASPSDVLEERQIAQEVIADWNAVHSEDESIVLLPLLWERNSTPIQGTRPQEIINSQLLGKADILVAIFWNKIGSPTGVAPSGTVEELRTHVAANKPAILYFSSAAVDPDTLDTKQMEALRAFRAEAKDRGLYQPFDSKEDFRQKFTRHLAKLVIENESFAEARSEQVGDASNAGPTKEPPLESVLSREAIIALKEAAMANGHITSLRHLGGASVQAGRKVLNEGSDRRSQAKWEGALRELTSLGLIRDNGYKGEIFEVTREGYDVADRITKDW